MTADYSDLALNSLTPLHVALGIDRQKPTLIVGPKVSSHLGLNP